MGTLIIGLAGFLLFAAIAVVSNLFANATTSWWTTGIFVGFALMALPITGDYFAARHEVSEEGLRYGRLIGSGGLLRWDEVKSVRYSPGMFDRHPRSRELIYILLAQRAARAQGDLRMHARQATLEQAAAFTSANTPRGWLSLDGQLVRGEQHLYLRQPAYGTSYLLGKFQIERLLADRRRQFGSEFTMRRFMDEFNAAGLIPISLIRWELTGVLSDDLKPVLTPSRSR